MDTDMEVLKNLDEYLEYSAFIGFESDKLIGTAIIGSKPKNKFILECLNEYEKLKYFEVMPKLVTKVALKYGLKNNKKQEIKDCTIFPKEYFYPLGYNQNFSSSLIKNNSYSIHWWEGSWKKKTKRFDNIKFLSNISYFLLKNFPKIYTLMKEFKFKLKYKKLILVSSRINSK